MVLVLWAGISSAQDAPELSVWDLAPSEVRAAVHLHANGLPPYPEDNAAFLEVQTWPLRRTFDGVPHVLEFSAHRHDVIRAPIRKLSDIPSGWSYRAYYVADTLGGQERRPGPSYSWWPNHNLAERSYGRLRWSYDKKGRIHQWSDSLNFEWFDAKGNLIAVNVGGKQYWQGNQVSLLVLERNLEDYWKRSGRFPSEPKSK